MSDPSRESERRRFLAQALHQGRPPGFDAGFTVESASVDASFRSYWRVRNGGASAILMDAPPQHEDVRPWLDVDRRLLAAGLNAPRPLAVDADAGFVLMSDLGARLYLPELTPDSVDALYAVALDTLVRMQTRVEVEGLPPYDGRRLLEEMELMPAWFLRRHLGFDPDSGDQETIAAAFSGLVEAALEQPCAFVHRDYHSRNLLVSEGAGPGLLDFQDAVVGPVTYDLVSLLRDCYVAWPEPRVYEWAQAHRCRLQAAHVTDAGPERFGRWFDLMGLQRHLKVLGIFCRLWYRDGKPGYLQDLPLVWHYTREVGLRHRETRALVGILERAVAGRDLTAVAA
ncbi:MAG TPA: phosphotransferase [Xanthomonadaceae bacterium]|nr:phosphotransferase [Xanthomonadaceae bacterium]